MQVRKSRQDAGQSSAEAGVGNAPAVVATAHPEGYTRAVLPRAIQPLDRMNYHLALRWSVPTLLGLLFAACESTETNHSGDLGTSAVQFQDIVVPQGLKLVERFAESHSREAAGWRYGHFEYVGQTTIQEACSHLLDRMPQHSWQLVSDKSDDPKTRHIQFKRGAYVVDYRLERNFGETHMVVDYDTKIEGR